MKGRRGLIGVLLALSAALAVVAAAYATPDRAAAPAATAASGSALVKCGKTRTIGFMVPATGPAASNRCTAGLQTPLPKGEGL